MSKPPTDPMPAAHSALVADFARTCKAAARAVALYPGDHPAIAGSLSRLTAAAARLTSEGPITFEVYREALAVQGRLPARPDPAIAELATLLHERLIGTWTVQTGADAEDWRAMLLLLAEGPEELRAAGGVADAWTRTGRAHFAVGEIDYAEALRERVGEGEASWDRIIARCLRSGGETLDDHAIAALLESAPPGSFHEVLDRLQASADAEGVTVGVRVAALLRMAQATAGAPAVRGEAAREQVLQELADGCATLTPDTMLGLLERSRAGSDTEAETATAIVSRVSDQTAAAFAARSVTRERGATGRLAQALEALVPSSDDRARVMGLARDQARAGAAPDEAFDRMWQKATEAVLSSMIGYSDESYVSKDYARELSDTKAQALDVERVSDDPPERVRAWLATVSPDALHELDLQMLLDLLQIEAQPERFTSVADLVVSEIERRTRAGEVAAARTLTDALVRETSPEGRPGLAVPASAALARLAAGPLVGHVTVRLGAVEESGMAQLGELLQAIGPAVVAPLTDALVAAEDDRTIRRLGHLLLRFGSAGRRSVERLRRSAHAAVRRTAVEILGVAGGPEALSELAPMLDDADTGVQREAVRAIARIGTSNAHAVLLRLLLRADTPRGAAVQELVGLRDQGAAPLFCYMLMHSLPRGRLAGAHMAMIEALGELPTASDTVPTLHLVLHRGDWWAPLRTAALRRAAAEALVRLGTPEALDVLDTAATGPHWGARRAAQALGHPTAPEGRDG